MQKMLVIGSGGLAREITDWFAGSFEVIGYATGNAEEHSRFSMRGECFEDNATPERTGADIAVVGIGSPKIKELMYRRFKALGYHFPPMVHPSAIVSSLAKLDEGVVVSPNCMIATGVRVGKCTHCNLAVGVGHEAAVGDFCQINPGAQIGGTAVIGDRVTIGSGATVLQSVRVGSDVVVASGAVVFSRVREGVTVLGNPAKRMWDSES